MDDGKGTGTRRHIRDVTTWENTIRMHRRNEWGGLLVERMDVNVWGAFSFFKKMTI